MFGGELALPDARTKLSLFNEGIAPEPPKLVPGEQLGPAGKKLMKQNWRLNAGTPRGLNRYPKK